LDAMGDTDVDDVEGFGAVFLGYVLEDGGVGEGVGDGEPGAHLVELDQRRPEQPRLRRHKTFRRASAAAAVEIPGRYRRSEADR